MLYANDINLTQKGVTTASWLLWHIIRKTIHILYFLCQLISNCHITNAFALKFIKPPVLHTKHKGIIIICFSGRVCQEKKLSKSFNFTFHYIHDVLTLSNSRFNDFYIWHLSQWTWDKHSQKKNEKQACRTVGTDPIYFQSRNGRNRGEIDSPETQIHLNILILG